MERRGTAIMIEMCSCIKQRRDYLHDTDSYISARIISFALLNSPFPVSVETTGLFTFDFVVEGNMISPISIQISIHCRCGGNIGLNGGKRFIQGECTQNGIVLIRDARPLQNKFPFAVFRRVGMLF